MISLIYAAVMIYEDHKYISFKVSSHALVGFQSSHFPSGFPNKILCTFLILPIHGVCPTHLIFLDLIIIIFNKFKQQIYIHFKLSKLL
jgi:hypothetical protein